jgi:hypothetical protein
MNNDASESVEISVPRDPDGAAEAAERARVVSRYFLAVW